MSGSPVITNPNGAFGYTDLQTQIYTLVTDGLASAAIVAKVVVAIGTDGQWATAATNGTASLARGVAQNAIASGNTGVIIVGGIAEDVPAAGAVARGDIVKRSATTAGYVSATASPATGEALGVAINASSSNVVDILLY